MTKMFVYILKIFWFSVVTYVDCTILYAPLYINLIELFITSGLPYRYTLNVDRLWCRFLGKNVSYKIFSNFFTKFHWNAGLFIKTYLILVLE